MLTPRTLSLTFAGLLTGFAAAAQSTTGPTPTTVLSWIVWWLAGVVVLMAIITGGSVSSAAQRRYEARQAEPTTPEASAPAATTIQGPEAQPELQPEAQVAAKAAATPAAAYFSDGHLRPETSTRFLSPARRSELPATRPDPARAGPQPDREEAPASPPLQRFFPPSNGTSLR